MQTLSEEQLSHVAMMSNNDEHFKSVILKPFLRTRVSDTDGNRAVREVCHCVITCDLLFNSLIQWH